MLQQYLVPIVILYAAFSIREVFIANRPGGVRRTITSALKLLVALLLAISFWLSWHTASGSEVFQQLVAFVSACVALVAMLVALFRRVAYLRHSHHYG